MTDPIKARLTAATPGPWNTHGAPFVKAGHELVATVQHARDVALIAHAPTDLAALIAEVERTCGTTALTACTKREQWAAAGVRIERGADKGGPVWFLVLDEAGVRVDCCPWCGGRLLQTEVARG